jgi:hypothetical protein
VPLAVLEIELGTDPDAALYHEHPLVVSRPDQHVAWRGRAVPADPAHLVATLRGA